MSEHPKQYKRHTVTAALPYANGPLHIGHLAGAYLPADIYVRYMRSIGEDVLFICGTDEHGAAISIQAVKEGTTPQAIVDKYHPIIKGAFDSFGISFDNFSRTSRPIHHQTAQEFFKKFHEDGKLTEESREQLYDAEAGMFLADRYVKGTCPKCENPEAYGDQCERCGSSLNATDLIDPVSAITGTAPVLKETRHWYLPLDQYQERLEKFILEDHQDWKSNVYGQCKSWLQDGLRPRAITRDLDWGVKVPVEGGEGKVLYVWFDAPIGYISATKEWAAANQKDWEPYWQSEDTSLVHFIGKDNIVFHCIIFPSILMGHGDYILPSNVPANEFLNLQNRKISTSKGWGVWMHEFVEEHPDLIDVMRYVLTSIMPETKDADFTWEDFRLRNDKELKDTFANFVNRVKVLSRKNFAGVPARGAMSARDKQVMEQVLEQAALSGKAIEAFRFKEALNAMMEVARAGDKYLTELEPWKLIKTDSEAAGHVLNIGLNIAAVLATVASPFMPGTSDQVFEMLGIQPLKPGDLASFDFLQAGAEVKDIPHLFSALPPQFAEQKEAQLMKKAEEAEKAGQVNVPPIKDLTDFNTFQQMDIRIGTILEAEKVPKSSKLLKLLVDLGHEKRTILSGVAKHFTPEDLIGRQCTVLANLPPRPMMGTESNGMVLFAEDSEGNLHLVGPDHGIENGSTVN